MVGDGAALWIKGRRAQYGEPVAGAWKSAAADAGDSCGGDERQGILLRDAGANTQRERI